MWYFPVLHPLFFATANKRLFYSCKSCDFLLHCSCKRRCFSTFLSTIACCKFLLQILGNCWIFLPKKFPFQAKIPQKKLSNKTHSSDSLSIFIIIYTLNNSTELIFDCYHCPFSCGVILHTIYVVKGIAYAYSLMYTKKTLWRNFVTNKSLPITQPQSPKFFLPATKITLSSQQKKFDLVWFIYFPRKGTTANVYYLQWLVNWKCIPKSWELHK